MVYDFAIVGGGIVGLAVGMTLSQRYPGAHLVVVEKESQLAFHQTGNNSGVIHSGVYYKPGSFKAKFCRDGAQSMVRFCQEHNIPHEVCGKVIVATQESELPALENLYQRGLQNGVPVKKITAAAVRDIEPHVSCIAGIQVFSTGIADYKQVCQKYAELVEQRGGEIRLNTKVLAIVETAQGHILETTQGKLETRFLINCAGLFSDRLAQMGGVEGQRQDHSLPGGILRAGA